jgi:hypothetical protein
MAERVDKVEYVHIDISCRNLLDNDGCCVRTDCDTGHDYPDLRLGIKQEAAGLSKHFAHPQLAALTDHYRASTTSAAKGFEQIKASLQLQNGLWFSGFWSRGCPSRRVGRA